MYLANQERQIEINVFLKPRFLKKTKFVLFLLCASPSSRTCGSASPYIYYKAQTFHGCINLHEQKK
jgi:hypothetical protein